MQRLLHTDELSSVNFSFKPLIRQGFYLMTHAAALQVVAERQEDWGTLENVGIVKLEQTAEFHGRAFQLKLLANEDNAIHHYCQT